jgi:hypothetical protein
MTLELTKEEATLIINALAEVPAKFSFNLILKINQELAKLPKDQPEAPKLVK